MTSCSSSRQTRLSRCYSLKKIANRETVELCKVHSTLNFDSNLTGTRQILYLETDLILISSLVWLLRIEKSVIFILVMSKILSINGVLSSASASDCGGYLWGNLALNVWLLWFLFSFPSLHPQHVFVQMILKIMCNLLMTGPAILLILCIPSSKEYLGSLLLTVSLRWGQRDGGSWASSRT